MKSFSLNKQLKSRFYFLDLLRWLSILAIVPFHFVEFTIGSESQPLFQQSWIVKSLIEYARLFSFSGMTVIFLSFFLFGYRGFSESTLKKAIVFSTTGYIVLATAYFDVPFPLFYWDVFSFLFVAVICAFLYMKFVSKLWPSLLAFLMASFYPWSVLHLEALGGICTNELQSSWPLFPWLFGAVFFSALGRWTFEGHGKWLGLFKRNRALFLTSGVFLIMCLWSFLIVKGQLLSVPAGSGMYCFFQQWSWDLKWALIVFLGLLFFAGTFGIQSQESSKSLFAKSAWNKNFGVAYLIQIVLLGLISKMDWIVQDPLIFDLGFLAVFIGTEIVFVSLVLLKRKDPEALR